MAHGVDHCGQILEGFHPSCLFVGNGSIQLLGQTQNLRGDHIATDMAAAAVGYGVAQALTYSPARLISSKLKAL